MDMTAFCLLNYNHSAMHIDIRRCWEDAFKPLLFDDPLILLMKHKACWTAIQKRRAASRLSCTKKYMLDLLAAESEELT
jgi:hypothetical protein